MGAKSVYGTMLSSLWVLSTVVDIIKQVIGNIFIPSSQMNHRVLEFGHSPTVWIHWFQACAVQKDNSLPTPPGCPAGCWERLNRAFKNIYMMCLSNSLSIINMHSLMQ